jgi:predicted ATPase
VSPLALPDLTHLPESNKLTAYGAVALFVERAQARLPAFQLTQENARAIAELCVRLDGLPLAIELAAARITLLPPRALLARLSQRFQLLTGGARTQPARQHTLHNTLQWSYDLLTTQEQRLFRCLCVFVGGFTLEGAEAVCKRSSETEREAVSTLDVVASLLDKSFLLPGKQEGEEPRLLMLETIRAYGLETLAASGEMESTRCAHAAYYLRLAEKAEQSQFGAKQALWLALLEREHDNLRAALDWAFEQGETGHSMEFALRLGGALEQFWILHGYFIEGWTFLERALVESQNVRVSVRAKALRTAAYLALNQEDVHLAATFCEESLALSRELDDTAGIIDALEIRGHLASMRYDFVAARSLIEEVVSLAREMGDKWRFASVLHDLAWVCLEQGEYSRAQSIYEECLTIFRELGNLVGIASSLHQLALVLFVSLGDHERVGLLLEESLVLWKQISEKNGGIARWSYLSGLVALRDGDSARAHALLEESVVLSREIGDRWRAARSLSALASVEALQSDYTAARTLYHESLTLYRQMGNKNIAPVLEGLAEVAVKQGQPVGQHGFGERQRPCEKT